MDKISADLTINERRLTMTFDPASPVHQAIMASLREHGAYEPGTQFFLMRVLGAGATFVDVGAHIGYFTVLAAALVGEAGRVIAVEAVAENFRQLQDHVANNDLPQASLFHAAISDADGEVDIHVNADNDGGHALWDPGKHDANEKSRQNPRAERVPSMRLETLLGECGVDAVDLVKIDTEGAEAAILEGSRDLLARGVVNHLIVEVNASGLRNMGSDMERLFALARELGFVISLPKDDGTPPVLLAHDNLPNPRYVFNVILSRPEALARL